MSKEPSEAKIVFGRALEMDSPSERAAYLDEVCCGRPQVRAEVEGLLQAHEEMGSFMAAPALRAEATRGHSAISEGPGTVIDHYTLLRPIGQGGFGIVFEAEQRQPVVRKVALKIIKPGMDSRQVVARFEAERQALALMDHPNIARVLDAGATATGRPYFVMDLVQGPPITEYCDANHLCAEERLRLFVAICGAVQHAHQRGIIHRDIKPSNILVAIDNGHPVPKIIDFGVSKAINQRLTENTLFTPCGQIIGTPQYMSPEQADMNGLDVDTRSDVYSLGVLLYELLTGTTPLEEDRLRRAGYAEIHRLVRDEDAPRPSARLSALGERLTVIAQHRSTDAKRLPQILRGELDWIAMKALEKERARRYESPHSLAADVERFLSGQAVEAHPPSASYRLWKLVRRNRAAAVAVVAVTAALVLAVAGTSLGLYQATCRNEDLVVMTERLRQEVAEKNASLAREATERRRAQESERQSRWHLYVAQQFPLADALSKEDYGHLITYLDALSPSLGTPDFRGWEYCFLRDQCTQRFFRFGGQHGKYAPTLALHRETARLALATEDGTIEVWDLSNRESVCRVPPTDTIRLGAMRALEWSPDGTRLACGGANGELLVIDGAAGRILQKLPRHSVAIAALAWSPNGQTLASAIHGKALEAGIRLWDTSTWQLRHTLRRPEVVARGPTYPEYVDALHWHPDGIRLLSGHRFGGFVSGMAPRAVSFAKGVTGILRSKP